MYKLSAPVPVIYNSNDKTEFNLTNKDMSAGKYISLKVSDGTVQKWNTSNQKTAKVTQKGKVTTLTKGTAIITATLTTGEKLKCTVKVTSNPVLKAKGKKSPMSH